MSREQGTNVKRLPCCLLFLFVVCFSWTPSAAATSSDPVILICFKAEGAGDLPVREGLKAQRTARGWDKSIAPIMRLYHDRESHRRVMQELGLEQKHLPLIALVHRDASGRPVEIVDRFAAKTPPKRVLDQFEQRFLTSKPPPSPTNRLGVLLILDPAAPNGEKVRQAFLKELGLLLQQQHKDIKPDFPLMHYDVSRADHAAYVDKLGISRGRAPLAVVTEFYKNLPVKLVDRGGSLNTPALTSRRVLATLKTAQVTGVRSAADAPAAAEVVYTNEGLLISVVRSHQLATQLYETLKNRPLDGDEQARQDLLGIVENAGAVRRLLESGVANPRESMRQLLLNIADFRGSQDQLRLQGEQQVMLRNLLEVLLQVVVAHRQLLGR